MPLTRYQIKNEYGLSDPDLYRAADKDDPEALLEGVAMAGLVGLLRQLGDLAEFAAEIFHDLHEEVMATAARGHGLMFRVQQLEVDIPLVEKAILSQSDQSSSFANTGLDWHPNLRMEQNMILQGGLPRCVMDSYEDCRGPPQLFLLDKFDVAGAGACLKRYTDPSYFKTETATSEIATVEKRSRKAKGTIGFNYDSPITIFCNYNGPPYAPSMGCCTPSHMKKGSRWKNGGTPYIEPTSHAKLHQLFLEESIEFGYQDPARLVKLKRRDLNRSSLNSKSVRSYMEKFLQSPSPEYKAVCEIPVSVPEVVPKHSINNLNEVVTDRDIIMVPGPTKDINSDEVPSTPRKLMVEKEIVTTRNENTEAYLEAKLSEDLTSEVDNFMDALASMDSEFEVDNEYRHKSESRFLDNGKYGVHCATNEEEMKIPPLFSESQSIGNTSASDDEYNLKKTSSFSNVDTMSTYTDNEPSDDEETAKMFQLSGNYEAQTADASSHQLTVNKEETADAPSHQLTVNKEALCSNAHQPVSASVKDVDTDSIRDVDVSSYRSTSSSSNATVSPQYPEASVQVVSLVASELLETFELDNNHFEDSDDIIFTDSTINDFGGKAKDDEVRVSSIASLNSSNLPDVYLEEDDRDDVHNAENFVNVDTGNIWGAIPSISDQFHCSSRVELELPTLHPGDLVYVDENLVTAAESNMESPFPLNTGDDFLSANKVPNVGYAALQPKHDAKSLFPSSNEGDSIGAKDVDCVLTLENSSDKKTPAVNTSENHVVGVEFLGTPDDIQPVKTNAMLENQKAIVELMSRDLNDVDERLVRHKDNEGEGEIDFLDNGDLHYQVGLSHIATQTVHKEDFALPDDISANSGDNVNSGISLLSSLIGSSSKGPADIIESLSIGNLHRQGIENNGVVSPEFNIELHAETENSKIEVASSEQDTTFLKPIAHEVPREGELLYAHDLSPAEPTSRRVMAKDVINPPTSLELSHAELETKLCSQTTLLKNSDDYMLLSTHYLPEPSTSVDSSMKLQVDGPNSKLLNVQSEKVQGMADRNLRNLDITSHSSLEDFPSQHSLTGFLGQSEKVLDKVDSGFPEFCMLPEATEASLEESPPLPPLPPMQWLTGKGQQGILTSSSERESVTNRTLFPTASPFAVNSKGQFHFTASSDEESTPTENPFIPISSIVERTEDVNERFTGDLVQPSQSVLSDANSLHRTLFPTASPFAVNSKGQFNFTASSDEESTPTENPFIPISSIVERTEDVNERFTGDLVQPSQSVWSDANSLHRTLFPTASPFAVNSKGQFNFTASSDEESTPTENPFIPISSIVERTEDANERFTGDLVQPSQSVLSDANSLHRTLFPTASPFAVNSKGQFNFTASSDEKSTPTENPFIPISSIVERTEDFNEWFTGDLVQPSQSVLSDANSLHRDAAVEGRQSLHPIVDGFMPSPSLLRPISQGTPSQDLDQLAPGSSCKDDASEKISEKLGDLEKPSNTQPPTRVEEQSQSVSSSNKGETAEPLNSLSQNVRSSSNKDSTWPINAFSLASTCEVVMTNENPRVRPPRPRNPLVDAFTAHDRSTLRKVSETVRPRIETQSDEMSSLLEQIRKKSFNLKPPVATRPSTQLGPRTNLKVAAILEKANTIRQAMAGSDSDSDSDSWSDS